MSEISTVTIGERQVLVKREDLLHPFVSGNKFRKLKYNLLQALELGATEIISFGGAFSNHIHALSYACYIRKIRLIIYVRGENVSNPTLDFVRTTGAKLIFVSRSEYSELKTQDSFPDYPSAYVVPEGGSNMLALRGIGEMMDEISYSNCQFCVSYGSGATSIGMMKRLGENDQLHIFSALKMKDFRADFERRCEELEVAPSTSVVLHDSYHFGGFAKFNDELVNFINGFEIPLDPLYTGKMMYGLQDLLLNGAFDHREIIAIHTGGMQGVEGFNERYGGLIDDRH